jgi:hypothetical protein
MDGDAGLCPPPGCFPTYDDDECYADGDAGLLIVEAYTIDPFLNVVPCPCSLTGQSLGQVCTWAQWGANIDLEVHNHMPSDVDGYVNVMCDWFRDGDWGDIANCAGVAAPEHVLVNFPVPNPFDGPLSLLMPPAFLIGPRSGYVWMRCSITEQQVPMHWDGSGAFEDGESEAYLILVDPCTQPSLDWGDAPDMAVAPGYPTLSGNNGANHVISGPWLGDISDFPDAEPDGQPDGTATGDDLDGNDDEDGVQIPVLVEGQTSNITFQVSGGGGVVQIWIDWNGNMSWSDAGEMVYNNLEPDGLNGFTVTPPAGSAGQTFLRARISANGGLPPDGPASDGEVEDHEVRIEPPPVEYDYGDAPDPNYPTLLASNGARHIIGGPYFCDALGGDNPDADNDGQPTPLADGDDLDVDGDDEDGVTIPLFTQGQSSNISFDVCGSGVAGANVEIWIDWNGNESWLDPGELVYINMVWDGNYNVPVTAPSSSVIGLTFARCRISTAGTMRPEGLADDGEVEDHPVTIEPAPDEYDFGDAPDPNYPTWLVNNGARHVIGGPFFCDLLGGDAPDADPDGQPTPLADGDDLDADGDDEDGVTIPNFNQGQTSNILFNVCNAPGGANVQIWIDWDGSGSWENPAERVYSNLHFDGNYSVPITAPATSVIGLTFARCRISTGGGLRPDGLADDGEVEDHTVTIEPAPQEYDFGDAPDPNYPTWLVNNGARHFIGGPFFCDAAGGDAPDAENNGQPTALADGDDLDVDGDDEDGVIMPNFNQGQSSNVFFNVCGATAFGAWVQIWIDWDGSGSWEAAEMVYNANHNDGNWNAWITAPATSTVGLTFARCRISSAGGLGPDGPATDGEVEDHTVTIEQTTQEYDFGDAPDPNYPTWLANNGARHLIQARIYLGNGVDAEADGQPNASATPLMPGGWAQIDVNSNALGMLDAWIDFGGDGTWVQPVDQIFASQPLNIGSNFLWFPVPFMAQPGSTFARFRMSTTGGLPYDGQAQDGEVEDYEVDIEENPEIKWIQLPDTSPNGIDIKVTGITLADDFECTTYGPITDVHLWCSWKYNEEGLIENLHLSFHTDDPVGPGGSDPCNLYSQPDELKWERDFTPGEFTITPVIDLPVDDGEYWWDPVDGSLIQNGDWTIYRLDVYIDPCDAFTQEGDPCEPVIYWLDVRVETEFGELGWKTRRWPDHYMDDAVMDDAPLSRPRG